MTRKERNRKANGSVNESQPKAHAASVAKCDGEEQSAGHRSSRRFERGTPRAWVSGPGQERVRRTLLRFAGWLFRAVLQLLFGFQDSRIVAAGRRAFPAD